MSRVDNAGLRRNNASYDWFGFSQLIIQGVPN
jgi:hypothetical protein